jgi:hypothetical protein
MNTPLLSQEKMLPNQKTIRVTVPVTPEVQAAFQRLAAASGMSTGKAMGEWLLDTMEGALTMAEMLEKARRAPKQAVSEMHAYALGLADLTTDLMETLRKGQGNAKQGAGERPEAAQAGACARPDDAGRDTAPGSAEPLPPRTVIRGGKSTKTQKKP